MDAERGDAQSPLLQQHPPNQTQVSSANEHYNKPFSWKAPAIVLAFEFLESIAYSGIALNLVVYLGTILHGTTASSAANVDAWNGATFLTPVLGAFLADTYWGKVQLPTGSPLKSIVMVFVASFKKRRVEVPADRTLLFEGDDAESTNTVPNKLEHTDEFRCLDKAAVVLEDQDVKDSHRPWLLCTVTQVEEVKILIRMLPIWFTCVFYSAAMCQTATTFVQQGNAMNTKVGSFSVPAASLNSAEVIFMMIWVAFQDSVVIPIARRYRGDPAGLTLLQRMGVGRFLAIPAMASAALVETWRLRRVRDGGNLSIGWQLPQFIILACSDVFCGIAQLEFFYSEAPASMRSLCSAFSFLAMSLAYYVNTLVVSVVAAATTAGGGKGWLPANLNDGHLDYYFWLWTGISVVNYVVYTVFAKHYTVKKTVRQ
nr:unnamed protein product [Digitaria exilis]